MKPRAWKHVLTLVLTAALASACATAPEGTVDLKSPQEKAKLYTEMGTAALLRGELPQAIEDLRKALMIDEKNAIAHNHLGLAYYGLGKKDLAKKQIEKAIDVDPLYSDAHINLGNFAAEKNDLSTARAHYKKALDNLEYKTRHRALTSLAQLELRQGNTQQARVLLHRSIQMNPDYCISHFLLGTIYMRENNTKKAADEFKKSVANACAGNPEGHLNLGLSYMRLKDYDKARSSFVFLIEQFPETLQAQKAGDLIKDLP